MPFLRNNKKFVTAVVTVFLVLSLVFCFYWELGPVTGGASVADKIIEIKAGEGFRDIVNSLDGENLIRSTAVFKIFAVLSGAAFNLKPGMYKLNPAMTSGEIIKELVSGSHREVTLRIPEGASVYDVDRILSDAGVVASGSIVAANPKGNLEGKLFPDTYKFFTDSQASSVVDKFLKNFEDKTSQILPRDEKLASEAIILASILQTEVPSEADQRIVAGILLKRISAHMPLQVDASICYIKESRAYPAASSCYPLSALDFKIDSPYNTYLHAGLPPEPIGSPGFTAIRAALSPESSPYWYYLSDPATGKTIFSKTLDEQNQNRVKYLDK
ncbi:MAG: endolytic transglycosylase MltG [Patescibacteria group bacterium]|nr:endolytic transglycosylase MltG [Patescibacteria group bacterium]MDE2014993.1 endolytic transglycosylase MltG [Patescibacteria group bacterium]MDE2226422.1 endolytic transglycosylase MltG [Patescibacteria group bacterium]